MLKPMATMDHEIAVLKSLNSPKNRPQKNTEEHRSAGVEVTAYWNYLKAAGGGVGMLLNFGREPTHKRFVMGDASDSLPRLRAQP